MLSQKILKNIYKTVKHNSNIKHTGTTVLKNLNPETTYDLPSKEYKSRDHNLLNATQS